ncbi:MAG: hypothetical protein INR66_03645 [Gordonia polyisoprenivorans]|nr:hypothetical protein [Gordonia polyisoprenivorans]
MHSHQVPPYPQTSGPSQHRSVDPGQLQRTIHAQRTEIAELKASLVDASVENSRLRRAGLQHKVDDWMMKTIAELACRQLEVNSQTVLRPDPGDVAFRRGQGAAIGERIRSLSDGWDVHRHHQPDPRPLSAWLVDERARWEFHTAPAISPVGDHCGQRSHDGWLHEAIAHRDQLTVLHQFVDTLGGLAG